MIFQKFKTPGIAHVAYLIGDRGEAALIDPRRDIDEHLEAARTNKVRNSMDRTHPSSARRAPLDYNRRS